MTHRAQGRAAHVPSALTPVQLSRLAALCDGEGGVLGNLVVTATLDAKSGLLGPVQGVREKLEGAIEAKHVPRISAFAVSDAQKDLLDEPGMADHRLDTASPRLLGCSTFGALIDALAGLRHSRPNIRPIDFHWELRDTYRPAEFEGRNWLFRRIEQAIQGSDRGFIVLAAGPGFGKTAFALHLVERWREAGPGDLVLGAWHFLRKTDAVVSPAARMVGQLEWRLRDRLGCPLGAKASKDPITDSNAAEVLRDGVLSEAADKATEAGQKLLLVIDGLDEGFGQNSTQGLEQRDLLRQIFPGPQALPEGMFVLFTTRPGGHLTGWPSDEAVLIDVDRDDAAKHDNDADLGNYLEARLCAITNREAFDDDKLTGTHALAQRMSEACEGAFFVAEWFARKAGEDAAQFERWLVGEKLPRGIDGVLREDWKHKLNSLKQDSARRLFPVLAAAIAIWHEAGTKVDLQILEDLFESVAETRPALRVGRMSAGNIAREDVEDCLQKLHDWFDAGAGESEPVYTFRHSRIPELILDLKGKPHEVLVDARTQREVHRLLAWTSSRWDKLRGAARQAALANAPWHFARAEILGSALEEDPMDGGAMRLLAHWLGPKPYLAAVYAELDNAVSVLNRNYMAVIALAARVEVQPRTRDSSQKPDPLEDPLLHLRDVWRVLSDHGELLRESCCPLAPSLCNHLAAAWDPQSQAHRDLLQAAEDYPGTWLQRMNPEQPDRRLIAVLRGHTGAVTCIALSPDGSRIASGSDDRTLRLWDARTGVQWGEPLTGHTDKVTCLAWSPDGARLASGSSDCTLRLWSALTGKMLAEPLAGHTKGITHLAWSPDGTRFVSASADVTLRIWDGISGAPVSLPVTGHTLMITNLAWSPDGTRLASSSHDRTLRIWDASTGEPAGKPLIGHTSIVRCMAWSPDGTQLASGGDGSLRIWNARNCTLVGDPLISDDLAFAVCLAWSPDGSRIASGAHLGRLRIWNVRARAPVGLPTDEHTNTTCCLAWSPDGELLASGSLDTTVRLWSGRTGMSVGEQLTGHTRPITCLAWASDGAQLVTASDDGTLRVWDASAKGERRVMQITCPGEVGRMAWSPDGTQLAIAIRGHLQLWDRRTKRLIGRPVLAHHGVIGCLAWSPDSARLISAGWDSTLRLWSREGCTPIGAPQKGPSRFFCVAWSPDGTKFASGSDDASVQLWDACSGTPVGDPLTGHSERITSVAWSPDSKRLVTGSVDKTMRTWSASTGTSLGEPMIGHTDSIRVVAWSPDGAWLASGSEDKTLRLWDGIAGVPVGVPLTGHVDFVGCFAWSPGSMWLASGSWDAMLRLWNAHTREPVACTLGSSHGDAILLSGNDLWVAGARAETIEITIYHLRDTRRSFDCP